MEFQSRWV